MPRQEVLIEETSSDESVLERLAKCVEAEALKRTEANTAKNALRAAERETDAAKQFAAEFYARTRQIEMKLTVGGTEPEPE